MQAVLEIRDVEATVSGRSPPTRLGIADITTGLGSFGAAPALPFALKRTEKHQKADRSPSFPAVGARHGSESHTKRNLSLR
jgi:hypothetical protein